MKRGKFIGFFDKNRLCFLSPGMADIMVICGEPPERHMERTPEIVVEILSESTRNRDPNFKRDLYHRQGVGAYWMVQVDAQTIDIDIRQDNGTYSTLQVAEEVPVKLCNDCEIVIVVKELFKR
jgi:Uma2 family endonuclease